MKLRGTLMPYWSIHDKFHLFIKGGIKIDQFLQFFNVISQIAQNDKNV